MSIRKNFFSNSAVGFLNWLRGGKVCSQIAEGFKNLLDLKWIDKSLVGLPYILNCRQQASKLPAAMNWAIVMKSASNGCLSTGK